MNKKFTFVLTARDVSGNKAVIASVMQNAPSGLSLLAGQDSTLLGGTALTTTLTKLSSLARDPVSGDIYVYSNCQILKINAATSIVSRFAGHPSSCTFAGDGGAASETRFTVSSRINHGVVIDSKRNIYWVSTAGIWKYDFSTGLASIIVGPRQTPYGSADGTAGRQFNFGNFPHSLDLGKDDRLYFSSDYAYSAPGGLYYARVIFRLEDNNTVTKVAGLFDNTTAGKIPCAEGASMNACRLMAFSIIPGTVSKADRLLVTTENEAGFWEVNSQGLMQRRSLTGPASLSRYLAKRNAVGVSGGYGDGLYLVDVDTLANKGKVFGLDPVVSGYNTFEVVEDSYGGLYLNPPPTTSITYADVNNNLAYFAGRSALGGDGGPAVFAELRNPRQISYSQATGEFYLTDDGVNKPIVRKIDSAGNLTAYPSLNVGTNANLPTGMVDTFIAWILNYSGFYKVQSSAWSCLWACGSSANPSLPTLSTANSTQLYNASASQSGTDVAAITLGSVIFDGPNKYLVLSDRRNFSVADTRTFIRKIDSNDNMTEVAGSATMPYLTGMSDIVPGTKLIESFIGNPQQRIWVANGVFYVLNSQKLFSGIEGGTWVRQVADSVATYVVSRTTNKVYYLTPTLKLYVKVYTADGSGTGTLIADFTGSFQSLVLSEIRSSDKSLFFISGNSIYRFTHALIE